MVGGGDQLEDLEALGPAPGHGAPDLRDLRGAGKSTQAGAATTLMMRVTRRPCPVVVTRWPQDVLPSQVLARLV